MQNGSNERQMEEEECRTLLMTVRRQRKNAERFRVI
jgi:hypothetical protein